MNEYQRCLLIDVEDIGKEAAVFAATIVLESGERMEHQICRSTNGYDLRKFCGLAMWARMDSKGSWIVDYKINTRYWTYTIDDIDVFKDAAYAIDLECLIDNQA